MSDQIPSIQIPFKATSNNDLASVDWTKSESEMILPFGAFNYTNKSSNSNSASIERKVKEIKDKLKPGVPKVSDEFLEKVVLLAADIKCNPEDLLAIMYQESAGWNPAITSKDKNGRILYGGIIQMNPTSLKTVTEKYSKELRLKKNISMKEYLKLPREKQLDYAKGYFIMLKDTCNLENKAHLSAGETWGMLKSPKQTKARNQRFLKSLNNYVNKIKSKIFDDTKKKHIDIKN